MEAKGSVEGIVGNSDGVRTAAEGGMEDGGRRRSSRRSHLLSAVVGRRNNWFLSPGKLPEQFLIKSTRRHSYHPAAGRVDGAGGEKGRGGGWKKQAQEYGEQETREGTWQVM